MLIDAIKLSELVSIRAGHPIRGRIEPISEGGTPIITIKDLPNEISTDLSALNLKCVNITSKKKPNYIQSGDILFSGRGQKCFAVTINNIKSKIIASPHLLILSNLKKNVMPEYLSWYITHSIAAKNYFTQQIRGTIILHVPRTALINLPVYVPELARQKAIIQLHKGWKKEESILNEIIERREKVINNHLEKALETTGA
ncbi:MAG: restriction endonuclease subunit S [Fibrobacteria bacterium]|nr:restriction endonuclease subunit S [Fibrobacteria bacterium]